MTKQDIDNINKKLDMILALLKEKEEGKKRQLVRWEVKEIARRLKNAQVPVVAIASQLSISVPLIYQLHNTDYGVKLVPPHVQDKKEWVNRRLAQYIEANNLKVFEKAVFDG